MQILFNSEKVIRTDTGADYGPIKLHQCATKCSASTACKTNGKGVKKVKAADGTEYTVDCFCDGREDTDTVSTFSLCADKALCKDICDSSRDCYGILAHKTKSRCFLVRSDCQLALLRGSLSESADYDYLARMDPENRGGDSACPMGVAVTARGVANKANTCPAMTSNDQYDPPAGDDEEEVSKYVGSTCSSVDWDTKTGCGWVVTVPKPADVAAPGPDADCECGNNVEAANWIFGNGAESAEYREDICDETEPWLEQGYCGNGLFAALCANSCAGSCSTCNTPKPEPAGWSASNNDAAAALVTQMLDITVTADSDACTTLDTYNMCSDPVVSVVCAATCDVVGRRLSDEVRHHLESARHKYTSRFRTMLSEIEAFQGFTPRKLAAADNVQIYATFDPTSRPNRCAGENRLTAASAAAETEILAADGGAGLYSLWDFAQPVANLAVTRECRDQAKFVTNPSQFCEDNNMRVDEEGAGQGVPASVKADTCWSKCLAEGTLATRSAPEKYCSGADEAFNQYSNALCLPRESCEFACSQTDGCVGIEMHRSLPRCYLITSKCSEEHRVASTEYDLVDFTSGKVAYSTHSNKICSSSGSTKVSTISGSDVAALNSGAWATSVCTDNANEVCAERGVCEDICAASAVCSGFYLTADRSASSRCTFVAIPAKVDVGTANKKKYCSAGGQYGGEVSLADTLTKSSADLHYVQKKLAGSTLDKPFERACVAVLTEGDQDNKVNTDLSPKRGNSDDCTGGDRISTCYVSADGSKRFVWTGQDAFNQGGDTGTGVDRKCDGWALQAKGAGGAYANTYSTFSYNLKEENAASCTCDATDGARADCGTAVYLGARYAKLYRWSPPFERDSTLAHRCMSYPTCGTLMTCVLSKNRFSNEVKLQFRDIAEKGWISTASAAQRETMFNAVEFRPKTLISVDKSVAFSAKGKHAWTANVYRNVPGHTRFMLVKGSDSAAYQVVTVVSAAAANSKRELGREYANPSVQDPPEFQPWFTDVIRVERFGANGANWVHSGLDGDNAQILVYAPASVNVQFFRFDKAGSSEPIASSPHPQMDGWYSLVAKEDGDYVGTTISPCPAAPPLPSGNAAQGISAETPQLCLSTDHGDSCELKCATGYIKTGNFQCANGQWQSATCEKPPDYNPEQASFRLSHRSRLDYGWRIKKIQLYGSADCSSSSFKEADVQFEDSTSTVRAGYDGKKVFGSGGDWWSADLNINPYSVDETHTNTVNVDFSLIKGGIGKDVQCVKVTSVSQTPSGESRQYYPRDMTLHRGWKAYADSATKFYPPAAAGRTSAMDFSEVSPGGWTDFWTSSQEPTTDGSEHVVTFTTQCGKPNTIIYGELLKVVRGGANMGACYCKQACIDHIAAGCRSWKLNVDSGDCYLQKDIKKTQENCEQTANWVSGDTGLRLTGVDAGGSTTVAAGAAFTLSVVGVNLPTEEGATISGTTPPRQRIKVVQPGQDCAEADVADNVEGIGCSHPYFCAPRPTSTGIELASWDDLTIHSTAKEATYQVCYNRGFTYDRYQWYSVGSLTVAKPALTWSTSPATLTRTTPSFNLTIDGGAMYYALGGLPASLNLKVIRSYFSCDSVKTDTAKIGLDAALADSNTTAGATWAGITVYDVANEKFADVGEYKVCAGYDTYDVIPSEDGSAFLRIDAEEADSSHPRKVFTHQTLSGAVGTDQSFALKGHNLFGVSSSKLAIAATGECGTTHSATADVSEAKSSATGYVYTGANTSALDAGNYDVCHCDGEGGGAGAVSVYTVKENRVCSAGVAGEDTPDGSAIDGIPVGDVHADWQGHRCSFKCARGCTDASCFCGSFLPEQYVASETTATMAQPLCLDVTNCRDACEATTDCVGFDFDPERNFCWLNKGTGDCKQQNGAATNAAFLEGRQLWSKEASLAPCATEAEFSKVGTVTLGARAAVGNNWVLTPATTQAIEVTGEGMNWMTDRILVIDQSGTCGISGKSAAVSGGTRPVRPSAYSDPPHDPNEGPYTAPAAEPTVQWITKETKYCAGHNLPATTSRHQCYAKCTANAPCESDDGDCFCTGQMQGYDRADSAALCLDQVSCQRLCQETDGCWGIDMHRTLPRCFLNTDSCKAGTDGVPLSGLVDHDEYDFLHKYFPGRRLDGRRLLPAQDIGESWDEILRFPNVHFTTGGQFKVCFCDQDTLAANEYCKAASDFKIDIGTVHVSGVSCLIKDSKFQRGKCVAHYGDDKGLRCYTGDPPSLTIPKVAETAAAVVNVAAADAQQLSAWCLYGTEEETVAGCE